MAAVTVAIAFFGGSAVISFRTSGTFRRYTWLTTIPLYIDLYLGKVVWDTPCSRVTSSADTLLPNWWTTFTISASLCRVLFI